MGYRVLTVDTATLTTAPLPLVDVGAIIDEVHVLAAPTPAPALLLGSNGDLIPVFTGLQLSPCGADARAGLFTRNPTSTPLNGLLVVLIWTGGAGSSSGVL